MADRYRSDGGDKKFLFDFNLSNESIILDLGGYKGEWANEIFARYRCNIFIFEVVQQFAVDISNRFINNDKIQVNQFGLGGFTKKDKINISDDSSSVVISSHESSNYEIIEIIDIVEWINKNNIEHINLIKINIEGSEYELLTRIIDTGLINNIDNLLIQFHDFTPDSLEQMSSIQRGLQETHDITFQYKFVWEGWVKKTSK